MYTHYTKLNLGLHVCEVQCLVVSVARTSPAERDARGVSWRTLFPRVACNMMVKKNQNRKHYGTVRTLLLNCVKLLDKSRHPQVRLTFACSVNTASFWRELPRRGSHLPWGHPDPMWLLSTDVPPLDWGVLSVSRTHWIVRLCTRSVSIDSNVILKLSDLGFSLN